MKKENLLVFGLTVAVRMAEYIKQKTEQCTQDGAQNV